MPEHTDSRSQLIICHNVDLGFEHDGKLKQWQRMSNTDCLDGHYIQYSNSLIFTHIQTYLTEGRSAFWPQIESDTL